MEFSSILTSLWNKIGKPLPNISVGLVFIFLAPDEIYWVGYIFVALGISSIFEWVWHFAKAKIPHYRLKKKLANLPEEEFNLLNDLRVLNGITIGFDFEDEKSKKRFELLTLLEAKGLVEMKSQFLGKFLFYTPHKVDMAIKDFIAGEM